jgi:hypothetical protein
MTTPNDDYQLRQKAEDQNYRRAYEEWITSLAPDERAALPPGLEKAHIDAQGCGSPELDESRLVGTPGWGGEASAYEPEGVGENEDDVEEFPSGRESLQDSLRVMIAELFEARNPGLAIGVVGAAMRVDGCSPARVAKRYKRRESWVRDEATRIRSRIGITSIEDELALARVVGELAGTANTRLSLEVLALVSGICYAGLSQTAIGRRHGVTRAAVSKRCVEFTEKLGLPPSRAMKSEASRKVFAASQRKAWKNENRGKGGDSLYF